MSGITHNGPFDDSDHGPVQGRALQFHKRADATSLRLLYADNLRVWSPVGGGGFCEWELHVDGERCA